jgi:hypothetical protein
MSQPVQHQSLYSDRASEASLSEQMQRELLALYQRSDHLLRELTTVRQRMDELHSAMGGQKITLQALKESLSGRPSRAKSAYTLADAD